MDSSWLKSVTPYPFQMPNSHANAVIKTRIKTRHRQLLLDLPCLLYLCNRIQQRLFRRIIKPFNTDLELCHLINDCFGKQNHKTLKKLTYFLLGPEKAKILLVWWKFRVWSQHLSESCGLLVMWKMSIYMSIPLYWIPEAVFHIRDEQERPLKLHFSCSLMADCHFLYFYFL